MPRRQNITVFMIIAVSAFLGFIFVSSFRNQAQGTRHPDYAPSYQYQQDVNLDDGLLKGAATAPKLENATLKAELGNASWKLLHTMMAKFPDKPSADDSTALKAYIHLFARLYPCGDCAQHFQKVLEKYPPQVASRSTAAAWACHVHNVVNKRLKKKEFDCSKIGDFYDCGCAEDEADEKKGKGVQKKDAFTPLVLDEKEGLTRGG